MLYLQERLRDGGALRPVEEQLDELPVCVQVLQRVPEALLLKNVLSDSLRELRGLSDLIR